MGVVSRMLARFVGALIIIGVFAGHNLVKNLDKVWNQKLGLVEGIQGSLLVGANHATTNALQYIFNIARYGVEKPVSAVFYGLVPFLLVWGFWFLIISVVMDIFDMSREETVPYGFAALIAFGITMILSLLLLGLL